MTIEKELREASQTPIEELLKALQTSKEGLTEKEARKRLKIYGLNEIAREKPPHWSFTLFKIFIHPFNALLVVLGAVSYFLGNSGSAIVIFSLVTLSIFIRFFQDIRSSKAAEKLRSLVHTKITVLRKHVTSSLAQEKEIPIQHLVPGDLIHLSAGDLVPADVRLLFAKDLCVSQTALTGEAMPVEKAVSIQQIEAKAFTDISNLCFLGAVVTSGSAIAVVLKTANQTYFGSMAKEMIGYRPSSHFDKGVKQISWLLIKFICVLVPLIFLINALMKGTFLEAFLFALSVAVGITPEMLPVTVTANLAKGAIRMSKKKAVVKDLNAIQSFGGMEILCADKTGTLTQNRIILERYLNLEGEDTPEILHFAFLNSHYQTGLKNLMDQAILNHLDVKEELNLGKAFRKVDEIPFDFSRKRMSVIVEKVSHQNLMICKGAVEEVLSICKTVHKNGEIVPFTEELQEKAKNLATSLSEKGLRVLALSYKQVSQEQKEFHSKDETEMTLMGLLGFLDPPKPTAKKAIQTLKDQGIQIKVLTGDGEIVTRRICTWVGLNVDRLLRGDEINALNEKELKEAVEKTTVFVNVSPFQKARIIASLKEDHTVGFLGDGINDALALKEADIGISVDTAVDVAKESADIILLEKSLTVLGEGVLEGRKIFCNIMKYIKMAASSNFGNVFSIVGASLLLPFLPMLPIQLLVLNFLYDTSQLAIPFDHVDPETLAKPSTWDAKGIGRFMLFIGPISSLFDYATFGVLWFFFLANIPEKAALFQSSWFIESLLTQLLIIHMIRTHRLPFIQSRPSKIFLFSTLVIMAVGLALPYTYIGENIGLIPPPPLFYAWVAAFIVSYCFLTQLVKQWYIQRFHNWL